MSPATWHENWPEPKRRRRRYGGEMDPVMAALQLPLDEAIATLQARYPWPNPKIAHVSAFVYDAQRALAKGNVAEAERRAYDFIRTALAAQPELPRVVRARWWQRLWWWTQS